MCEIPSSRLMAWVDGELEDAALEAHIAECAACSGQVRRIRALSDTIVDYCHAMPASRSRARWWAPVAAAAAVLIVASGLLSLGHPPAPAAVSIDAADANQPGVMVVVALDEILPVGAAPPGAVLVGKLTFNSANMSSEVQFQ